MFFRCFCNGLTFHAKQAGHCLLREPKRPISQNGVHADIASLRREKHYREFVCVHFILLSQYIDHANILTGIIHANDQLAALRIGKAANSLQVLVVPRLLELDILRFSFHVGLSAILYHLALHIVSLEAMEILQWKFYSTLLFVCLIDCDAGYLADEF